MIKTKLILVDGITGSGKSTTAHYIYRQLKKNGIKAEWYYEEQHYHPVFRIPKQKKKENEEQYCKRYMDELLQNWKDFVEKIKKGYTVHIIESMFFQDSLNWAVALDLDRKFIKEYAHMLYKTVKTADPVLIHFIQEDVGKAMRRNWKRRGEMWTNSFIRRNEKYPFSRNRKLKGRKASIAIWNELTDITKELYSELDMQKVQIENSGQNWTEYRKSIHELLKIEQHEELLYKRSYRKYCDTYLGKSYKLRTHVKKGRLLIDAFWPNLKLIPVSDNEFELEGFPISFRFYKYKGIKKLRITEAGCYYDKGKISDKYIPVIISEKILKRYCGTYWCEEDKIERKIIMKDGKLFYRRDEGNESEMINMSETEFMMESVRENKINFEKVNGEWQFVFHIKRRVNPHALFVRKR